MAMDDVTAETIMIPLNSYPHVPYWFTLRQAIAEMEHVQLTVGDRKSLPRVVLVFDEEYRLIGIVRRRDILRGVGPDAMQESVERDGERDPAIKRDQGLADISQKTDPDDLRKRAERPVQEVMTPIRVSVPHDTPLMKVIQTMVVNDISLVPVLKDDVVAGVVRSVDVLRVVGDMVI
jgi:CBS domain-containing protein